MANISNHFYVTLFSNASSKIYKDNTLAAFTVKLAQPIDLGTNENWEVGLCEITCPPPTAGTLKPVLIVGDTNVIVYCNLISQQFVGENAVRCLRSFIFLSALCQHVFKEVFIYLWNSGSFKTFGSNFAVARQASPL